MPIRVPAAILHAKVCGVVPMRNRPISGKPTRRCTQDRRVVSEVEFNCHTGTEYRAPSQAIQIRLELKLPAPGTVDCLASPTGFEPVLPPGTGGVLGH